MHATEKVCTCTGLQYNLRACVWSYGHACGAYCSRHCGRGPDTQTNNKERANTYHRPELQSDSTSAAITQRHKQLSALRALARSGSGTADRTRAAVSHGTGAQTTSTSTYSTRINHDTTYQPGMYTRTVAFDDSTSKPYTDKVFAVLYRLVCIYAPEVPIKYCACSSYVITLFRSHRLAFTSSKLLLPNI